MEWEGPMAKSVPFELIAGNVALNFANTLDNRCSPRGETELLRSYDDLLRVCAQSRVLSPRQLGRLHHTASLANGRAKAADALRSAIRLRETIERIFAAVARNQEGGNVSPLPRRCSHGQRPSAGPVNGKDLAILNGYVKEALAYRCIAPASAFARTSTMTSNGFAFGWQWREEGTDLNAPFWPLALAAAELLVSGDLGLVRECRSATCRWLFLDKSKNHSRRWCDMKTCGNRVKARRYYRKRSLKQ
jgi:predicted RNA-binding Zn ribbon-like protein